MPILETFGGLHEKQIAGKTKGKSRVLRKDREK